MPFELTRTRLVHALDTLAAKDRHIAAGLEQVAGQQLSVKAAATIFGRLEQRLGGEFRPKRLLEIDDEELRGLGLSRQKVGYARGLAHAVLDGSLVPEALAELPDEAVIEQITRLKGFGRWSAEMFLLFSLGRPDVWPADDLGIQAGLHKLRNMRNRPDRSKTELIGRRWRPYRGAAAIFIWHYYSNAPM